MAQHPPPTVADVQTAVATLYQDPDPERKQQADKWLTALKTSPYAGQLGHQLMHLSSSTSEQFIGGVLISAAAGLTTAANRTQFALETLQVLLVVTDGIVVTKLCKAIAAVVVYPGPKGERHPLEHLCRSQPFATLKGPSLIQLLTAIAEEAEQAMERAVNTSEVMQLRGPVVQACHSILSTQDGGSVVVQGFGQQAEPVVVTPEIRCGVLLCLRKWGKMGLRLPELHQAGLFELTVSCLASTQCFEPACKLLGKMFKHTACPPDPPDLVCVELFCNQLPGLQGIWVQAAQAGDQGTALCLAMVRMLGKFGEAQLELVAAGRVPNAAVYVELMMSGTSHPEDAVASNAIEFWHDLNMLPLVERHAQMGAPLYSQLLAVLVQRVAYPEGFTCWDDSVIEQDGFEFFREQTVKDTIVLAGGLLGATAWRELLSGWIQAADWRVAEASLFALGCLSQCVEKGSTPEIDQQLGLMLERSLTTAASHPLQATAVAKLTSRYAHWISSKPAVLSAAAGYLVHGLESDSLASQPELAEEFATTLNQLAKHSLKRKESPEVCTGLRQSMLQLANVALHRVSYTTRTTILRSLSLMSAGSNLQELQAIVQSLGGPVILRLQQLRGNPLASSSGDGCAASEVTLLGAIVHSLEGEPSTMVVPQLWLSALPLVNAVLGELIVGSEAHSDTMAVLCAALTRSLSLVGAAMRASLETMVGLALPCFQRTQAACCQSLISKAVEVFGADAGFVPQFQQLLESMAAVVYSTVTGALDEEILANHFNLLHQYAIKCPAALLPTPNLNHSLELATVLPRLTQRDSIRSCLKFQCALFEPGCVAADMEPQVHAGLAQWGGQLLQTIFEAILLTMPIESVSQCAQILIPLARRDSGAVQQALAGVISQVECAELSSQHREVVVQLIVKQDLVFATPPKRYRAMLYDLAKICRSELDPESLLGYQMC